MNRLLGNERKFQEWVVKNIKSRGGHVQPIFGDDRYPGIPDLSVGVNGIEVWIEVKYWRKNHYLYNEVGEAHSKENRKLTAQQHKWLKVRESKGGAFCAVLVAWSAQDKMGTYSYVSLIPVSKWRAVMRWSIAKLILSPYTDTMHRLISGKNSIPDLISEVLYYQKNVNDQPSIS